jgi:hypothetical protein
MSATVQGIEAPGVDSWTMILTPGVRLGSYEIAAPITLGGAD